MSIISQQHLWVPAMHQTQGWQCRACSGFSLPLSLSLPCLCFLSPKINKLRNNVLNKRNKLKNNTKHGKIFHILFYFIPKADLTWLAYRPAIYTYILAELITSRAFGSKIFYIWAVDFIYDTDSKFYSSETRKCALDKLEKIFRKSWHLY